MRRFTAAERLPQSCRTSGLRLALMMPERPAVVLVEPKEAGNVGAAARAMKNMGLSDLRLVRPRCRLADARRLASHAGDLLERATEHESLLAAVGECDLVVGTTARERRDHAPAARVREGAAMVARASRAAVVFGREESGLANDELDLCGLLLTIPTSGDYASLNLGQAVLLVAYELMLARDSTPAGPAHELADRRSLEGLHAQLDEYLSGIGFSDAQRRDRNARHFRRILDRAALEPADVALLRGLLSQGLWAARLAPAPEEAGA